MNRPYIGFTVAALLVSAVVLAGCDGGSSVGAREKIRMQHSSTSLEAQQDVKDAIVAFNDSQDEYAASVEFLPFDQAQQKMLTDLTSGNMPDVIMSSSTQGSIEFLQKDAWADLSRYATDEWKQGRKFVPGSFDEIGNFGIPIEQLNEGVVFYDTAKLASAGLTPPPLGDAWDWDNFLSAAQSLTVGDTYGFADRGAAGFPLAKAAIPYFWSYGTDLVVKDGSGWKSGLETEAGQAAFRRYVELVTKYNVKPSSITSWGLAEAHDAWNAGSVAMLNIGDWFSWQIENGEFGKDWNAMLFPVQPGVEPFTVRGAVYLHIPESSKVKDGAWALIDYLMQDAILGRWTYDDSLQVPTTEGARQYDLWQSNAFFHDTLAELGTHGRYIDQEFPDYLGLWKTKVSATFQAAMLGDVSIDDAISELNKIINDDIEQFS